MASTAAGQMSIDVPDEALVAAARAGDRAAFSLLVARHRDTVFAYAYARLWDRDEAEDVAQETFMRAYLALDRLRSPGAWAAWMRRILRNLCNDALRRRRVRQTEPIDTDWLDNSRCPETLALAEEQRRELRAAVAELPEKYRIPLLMHYASGRTYREIAGALELPQSTIVGRIAGALRLLRRRLDVEERG
jgi:RNA polymerase sigma-70 factor (ECF subfamily)